MLYLRAIFLWFWTGLMITNIIAQLFMSLLMMSRLSRPVGIEFPNLIESSFIYSIN